MKPYAPQRRTCDPVTATVALVGATVVSTGAQLYQGQQAAKERKKQVRAQQEQQAIQARRERVAARNRAARAEANALAIGTNAGLGGSSFLEGGIGSIQSQFVSNLDYFKRTEAISNRISDSMAAEQKAESRADLFGAGARLSTFALGRIE